MLIKNKKLLVCDWDGTLADSVSKIIACKQFLAKKYKLPVPTDERIKAVLGMPFEKALALCFPDVEAKVLAQVGRDFHVLMQQAQFQADLFPSAHKVLLQLKAQGIYLAVATAKARIELDIAIDYLKIKHLFDLTCCSEEYQPKPNPAIILHIMSMLNVSHEACAMIGDTAIDAAFANNAGIKFIGVTFGAQSKETLSSLRPYVLMDDWVQLPQILGKLWNIKLV